MSELRGGWSVYSCKITSDEESVFKEAISGLLGVQYDPVAVASQVVSGMNYCFFCNAKVVYPGAPNTAAMISVYKPLEGEAHITDITQVGK